MENKEQQNYTNTVIGFIKESAFIIAFFTGLLFIWGYVGESLAYLDKGIPEELRPDKEIQEYLVLGGFISVFFFFPITVLGYIVFKISNRMTKGGLGDHFSIGHKKGVARVITLSLTLFATSMILLVPISRFVNRTIKGREPKVRSITFNSDSKVVNKYEGLIYVTKKSPIYIFVDKLEKGATVYLLDEGEVSEIVISSEP
jgi:hypothetical protein